VYARVVADPRLVLQFICSTAELFAFWRFVSSRAYRSFPWFAGYLLAGFVQSFVWVVGPPKSHAYAIAYSVTTPLILALQCSVTLELWRKLKAQDRHVGGISKGLGFGVLALALAVALSTGFDSLWGYPTRRIVFPWIFWAVRYTGSVLCVVCSLLAVWATTFERRLAPNLVRHAYLLTCYFGSIAAGYLGLNLMRWSSEWIGVFTVGSATALYVLWGVLTPPQRHTYDFEEQRVVTNLNTPGAQIST